MNEETKAAVAAITEADISMVINGILDAGRRELENMTQADLDQYWFYHSDPKRTPEQDAYEFFDLLELYRKQCRAWEEMHNGSVCVVERVRDAYLMPKIKQFVENFRSRLDAQQEQQK